MSAHATIVRHCQRLGFRRDECLIAGVGSAERDQADEVTVFYPGGRAGGDVAAVVAAFEAANSKSELASIFHARGLAP